MIIVRKVQIPALPTEKPRRLYIYLPRDYEESDRRYPVLYMFDGHNVFYNSHATYGKSWGMKEYLQKTKLPLIVVGIECNPEGNKRLSEYSPWDFSRRQVGLIEGRGKETMEWMTKELKPAVDEEFRTIPDRDHTMVAGSSMGGLMTVYAVLAYNDVFSRGAALSPAFFLLRGKVAELIKEKKPFAAPTRIYMDYGSAEWGGAPGHCAEMFRTAARLSLAGVYTEAAVIPDAQHSEAFWEKRIPDFMKYLYPAED